MRSIAIDEFGQSATLHDVPRPRPGIGEVLVRVYAAGVNPVDWKVADGWMQDATAFHFPLVLGFDLAGIVEECGEGVDTVREGDHVFGSTGSLDQGSYAEFAVAPMTSLARMPPALSYEQAAAVPIPAHTAMQALDELHPRNGDVILVVGASGGVGSYAVQLAAERGCTVLATALPDDEDFMLRLGATEVIDHSSNDVVPAVLALYPHGIDCLLDVVSERDELGRICTLLHRDGRAVSTIGAVDEPMLAARGITASNLVNQVTREGLERIAWLFESGRLRIPLQQTFPLEDAAMAIDQSRSGHVRGKLVLRVGPRR